MAETGPKTWDGPHAAAHGSPRGVADRHLRGLCRLGSAWEARTLDLHWTSSAPYLTVSHSRQVTAQVTKPTLSCGSQLEAVPQTGG